MHGTMRILYVEDCETTVMLFQLEMNRHCGDNDLTLHVASSVADAIQVYNAEKYNAVLIDWNLPDGDGLDVARHIRSVDKSLPLVFLSSMLTEAHELAASQFHPKACMLKGHGRDYIDTLLGHIQ